jgi:hypothetical protein
MLENATARRVLPTLWGIRRKDFIEDKMGCCVLLRDIGTCKTVIQRYENLALPNSLRLIPQHFPVFFVALRFSNTHYKSGANRLNGKFWVRIRA